MDTVNNQNVFEGQQEQFLSSYSPNIIQNETLEFVSADSFLGEPLPVAGPELVALEDEGCSSDPSQASGSSLGFRSIDHLLGEPVPIASADLECLEETNVESRAQSNYFRSIDTILGEPIPQSSWELECLEASTISPQVWQSSYNFQSIDSDISIPVPLPELEFQDVEESSTSTDVLDDSSNFETVESILGDSIPTNLSELESLEEPSTSSRRVSWRDKLSDAEAHLARHTGMPSSIFYTNWINSDAASILRDQVRCLKRCCPRYKEELARHKKMMETLAGTLTSEQLAVGVRLTAVLEKFSTLKLSTVYEAILCSNSKASAAVADDDTSSDSDFESDSD